MYERTIFVDENILITSHRIRINRKTYPIPEIKSAKIRSWKETIYKSALIEIFVGIAMAILGVEILGKFFIFCLLIGLFFLFRFISFLHKNPTYHLSLELTKTWQNIFSSPNQDYIMMLAQKINEAIHVNQQGCS
jgi:hypothetical protein